MAASVDTVDERIEEICRRLGRATDEFRHTRVPGLKSLLDEYIDPNTTMDYVRFHRGLLQVFKKSEDTTYEDILARHTPEEQNKIEDFVAGGDINDLGQGFVMGPSMGCREELERLHQADSIFQASPGKDPIHVRGLNEDGLEEHGGGWFHHFVHRLSKLFDRDSCENDSLLVYKNAEFQNWGLNITNIPQFTCVPNTVKGIQCIVKFAAEHNFSVRCSGYRHSWAPIFGRNGQVLISMLKLATATELPNIASLPFQESKPTELESIKVVDGTPRTAGNTLVRIGCATTNERLRRWCVENNKVTIPLNVIMVEITIGGSNAPICHGAGRRNQTLSDLVRKIEYVDCFGNWNVVDKPEHLRAASGCFGLMGVISHITLEFPPMTYAMLAPMKMPVVQAVPPPPDMKDEDIPVALLKDIDRSPTQKLKDQKEFEKRATNDYYAEWFWFPFSDYAWVNTWNNVKDPSGVTSFPDDKHIFFSFLQTITLNILQYTPLLDELIDKLDMSELAVTIISRAAMYALPERQVKTYLPDALHFQRAIQNIRVHDMEVEMPLVAKVGEPGKIDFSIVQRAWWDAILNVYKPAHLINCPMRMPLEMRIMGGSDVVMAPQRHNSLGTCSIEILTLQNHAEHWIGFAQEVLDKWMSYTDPNTGKRLNTRPHWAKEWAPYKVDGRPWVEKLKNESYKQELVEFKSILTDIGAAQGWTLADLKARFSNDFFDEFYFDGVGEPGAVPAWKKMQNSLKVRDVRPMKVELDHVGETSNGSSAWKTIRSSLEV